MLRERELCCIARYETVVSVAVILSVKVTVVTWNRMLSNRGFCCTQVL